ATVTQVKRIPPQIRRMSDIWGRRHDYDDMEGEPDARLRTRNLIELYESNNPEDAGLLHALDLAEEFLAHLPDSFSFTYRHATVRFDDLGARKFLFLLFHNLLSWFGFVLYSTAY